VTAATAVVATAASTAALRPGRSTVLRPVVLVVVVGVRVVVVMY
jgi:hypothetical protein